MLVRHASKSLRKVNWVTVANSNMAWRLSWGTEFPWINSLVHKSGFAYSTVLCFLIAGLRTNHEKVKFIKTSILKKTNKTWRISSYGDVILLKTQLLSRHRERFDEPFRSGGRLTIILALREANDELGRHASKSLPRLNGTKPGIYP